MFGAHCVGLACSLRLTVGCPQPPAPGGWNVTSRRMHDAFGLKLEATLLIGDWAGPTEAALQTLLGAAHTPASDR
eukprot:366083-Prymnesium_polylepis.1